MSSAWSPFDCLAVAATTSAGLLQRGSSGSNGSGNSNDASETTAFATEVELMISAPVELRGAAACAADSSDERSGLVPLTILNQPDTSKRAADYVDRSIDLQITVTTHRLVFFRTAASSTSTASNKRQARYFHLSNIFDISVESNYFQSPKIVLDTALGVLRVVFGKAAVKQRDECLSHLQLAWQRKQWDVDETAKQNQALQRKVTLSRKVGVDAILTASNQRHAQAQQLTESAFDGTAETLLQEATELVQIIQKYVATLDRNESSSASAENGGDEADRQRLTDLLQGMGLTLALNKADYQGRAAQAAYYDQTARQLADFLRPKLAKVPVMTLTDVYCLFNRARGSHLLSPEDLLLAVERLHELQLGLSLVTFPESGLKVIRDDSKANETVLAETFLSLCRESQAVSTAQLSSSNSNSNNTGGGYVTALSVSRHCHVAAVLALEQLQAAERAGFLVRDETVETIRFYPNEFNKYQDHL
jgi:ESCRT-II complex subunit VPS36